MQMKFRFFSTEITLMVFMHKQMDLNKYDVLAAKQTGSGEDYSSPEGL